MSSTEWETPQDFYDTLNEEFQFTIDVCALPETAKCDRYYSPLHDALDRDWSQEVAWMNPPYSRDSRVNTKWMRKAYRESQKGATVVVLIQCRSTETIWWHDYAMKSSELRFVKNRLYFRLNGKADRANHGSVVVVFRPYCQGPPTTSGIDTKGRFLTAQTTG